MSHRSQLTCRTHDSILREEIAWLRTEFAAYYILIESGITVDAYVAQVSLRSLSDAHFEVDRVAIDIDFGRIDVREHITIIIIEVSHRIIILIQALVQEFLIIYITLLHGEQSIQTVCIIDSITHPRDITDEILLTLIYLHIYIDMLLIVVADAIFQNLGITITILVVFIYQLSLILFPAFRCKLLRFEESSKFSCLMSLGECTFGE